MPSFSVLSRLCLLEYVCIVSFQTASALLSSAWLIDKAWADRHKPIVVSVLKGRGSFAGTALSSDEKKEEEKKAAIAMTTKDGVVYKVGYYTDLSRLPDGSIAMVALTGPLLKYGDECTYGMVDKAMILQRLANAPNIKGIILDVDSPGGQVSGTAMLADVVKNIRKPKIGMIDSGMAASAALWVISACDEVYVTQKIDQIGSAGVYQTIYDWNAYMEKEGLPVHEIYAPGSEDKNADYREALKGNYDLVKEDLKVIRDEFIETVSRNRAGKLTSDEWKSGGMFYAKDATRIGLIDGQKSFDQVVKRMDHLIANKSANSNNNTMAFEKTLTAAKADSFAVVDGGFLATEENLNNIEATLAANEAAATKASEDLTAANTAKATAEASLATANDAIATRDARITALEAENAQLKAGPAGEMKGTVATADKTPEAANLSAKDKYRTSYDDYAG